MNLVHRVHYHAAIKNHDFEEYLVRVEMQGNNWDAQ